MARCSAIVTAVALAIPLAAKAEQGSLGITPRIEAGKPLSMELRNFSKLPVTLSSANLALPGGVGGAPCALALPAAVSLAPDEMRVIAFAPARS